MLTREQRYPDKTRQDKTRSVQCWVSVRCLEGCEAVITPRPRAGGVCQVFLTFVLMIDPFNDNEWLTTLQGRAEIIIRTINDEKLTGIFQTCDEPP